MVSANCCEVYGMLEVGNVKLVMHLIRMSCMSLIVLMQSACSCSLVMLIIVNHETQESKMAPYAGMPRLSMSNTTCCVNRLLLITSTASAPLSL